MKKPLPTNLARALFRFFQDYLPAQRGMSLHTIHSYRDTVQLLLQYTAKAARRKIEAITLGDFTAEHITGFRVVDKAVQRVTPVRRLNGSVLADNGAEQGWIEDHHAHE